MGFDHKTYAEEFDRFLLGMMKMSGPEKGSYQAVLSEVCLRLRVAMVDVLFYKDFESEQNNRYDQAIMYSGGNPDITRRINKRVVFGKGNVAVYHFYPHLGAEEWDEFETEKITVLLEMIYTFNGRARLMELADTATFYDMDLHIPHMAYFKRTAGELIADGKIGEYGVCQFNLKRFVIINQRLGRKAGTQIMIDFVKQLQGKLSGKGCVCRISRDNFSVLFLKSDFDAIMQHLQGTEIRYGNEEDEVVLIKASAGFNMTTDDTDNLDEIIERAHIAAKSARNGIGAAYVYYDEKLQERRDYVNRIEGLFRDAIDKEEFQVYYQPKVNLKNYSLSGAEALCRWIKDGKVVPPNDFIPILEQSNAICELDFYMLEHVCRDIRRWLDSGQNVVRVSINLSRRHLGSPDLLENLLEIVDRYQIPHQYIEFELTETTTDVEFADLKHIVYGLKEQEIHTSVDDFGMGYSSLNLIRQVPWDVIKIDKSFLPAKAEKGAPQYIMFHHLLSMMQDMGMECVVEGVETVEQVRILKQNNCYLAQGFYFDRPLAVAEFEKRLQALQK